MSYELKGFRPVSTINNVYEMCRQYGIKFRKSGLDYGIGYVLVKPDGSKELAWTYMLQYIEERCRMANFYVGGLGKAIELALKNYSRIPNDLWTIDEEDQ
ncbi:hypothetical protein [Vibrio sp.]|uniref:hypothetical protein n=1 Tax=Vibrio sp. TaxID=678 RepID=UPI003AA8A0F5